MFVQLLKEFMGRKIGERVDVSETDANALVAQQIATPVTDDIITPAVQKAMEQAFSGFQKGLDAVINASLKQSRTPRPAPAAARHRLPGPDARSGSRHTVRTPDRAVAESADTMARHGPSGTASGVHYRWRQSPQQEAARQGDIPGIVGYCLSAADRSAM
jgi:hypothetical protein